MSVVGPVLASARWHFFMKVSNYIECDDAPVCSYDLPPHASKAIAWAKENLPNTSTMSYIPLKYVDSWEKSFTLLIDNERDATVFKLMWVG